MKQRIYIGEASLNNLDIILQEYSAKKVFLVRGKKSYELCGAQSRLNSILKKVGVQIFEFHDFEENPKIEDLDRGLLQLRVYHPDLILAIGGGSVLDMAKLLRFFYSYSGNKIGRVFEKIENLLPLIVIPTTAGTGSEATSFAVLYKNKVKYSVSHEDILPEIAFIDPYFTYNISRYLTACTGFDALAQAIEAYWNLNATNESDVFAVKAIKLLWPNLPLAVNNPTKEVRNSMSEGAYWAGCAINITKTTAPHAFSYPFTTYYGYPHGHAVALTFPFFMEYNVGSILLKHGTVFDKMIRLMEILNITNVNECKSLLCDYIENIGLDLKLPANFDHRIILSNINVQRLSNNPVRIDGAVAKTALNTLCIKDDDKIDSDEN